MIVALVKLIRKQNVDNQIPPECDEGRIGIGKHAGRIS